MSAHWGIEKVMHGEPIGLLIFVDDGSSATHTALETLPFALRRGDTVTRVAGPLAFTYEKYKIEPVAAPELVLNDRPLPMLAPPASGVVSIATFNVEDLFDFQEPHPSDPPLPSLTEYKHKLSKTAEAIRAMGAPTILGLSLIHI